LALLHLLAPRLEPIAVHSQELAEG